jgi:histone acetyltransferase (RNA polymerase elongator complex component)
MIIPFFIPHAGCPHQCVFCDQERITGHADWPDPEAVASTIRSYLDSWRQGTAGRPQRCDRGDAAGVQVAFFGGSFTALPLTAQESYLAAVQPFIASQDIVGIRVSTRPDAVSPSVIDLLARRHVTSVELGAQSLDDEVLQLSGRGHTVAETVKAVSLLRKGGVSVGLQIMPGLPGDTAETFHATVERSIALRPDSIRIYPALVIRGTPLERMYREGRYVPLTLEAAVTVCAEALTRFREAGITVIRVGLQPTEELERPGTIVAGPYHPALRQLAESSLFRERMQEGIELLTGGQDITFLVHPSDLSAAIGHKRGNIRMLREQNPRKSFRIAVDTTIPRGTVTWKTC